jgi:hypothetical protein
MPFRVKGRENAGFSPFKGEVRRGMGLYDGVE